MTRDNYIREQTVVEQRDYDEAVKYLSRQYAGDEGYRRIAYANSALLAARARVGLQWDRAYALVML